MITVSNVYGPYGQLILFLFSVSAAVCDRKKTLLAIQ